MMIAFHLVTHADSDLLEIVGLSLYVSLTATFLAALLGMPLGVILALTTLPGRRMMIVIVNAAMGLPPVVVGLFIYLILSRSGPLGVLGLLYTPTAMVVAQTVLALPIVAALTRQVTEDMWAEYREQLLSFGVRPRQAATTLLWEARSSLIVVALAGFGRASAEVGAVMIVGGNIDHYTRVMTTTIALETSKGNLSLALALGLILLFIALGVNSVVAALSSSARASL